MNRRQFVQTTGMLLAAGALRDAGAAEPKKRFKKALCFEMIQSKGSIEDKFRIAKDAGFEGVEVNAQRPKKNGADPKELVRASEKVGLPIHGVSGAGGDLAGAIEEAAIYGATSVLHVARADAKAPYMETYRKSQDIIRAAIPTAEKRKIPILVENVWATFLIEPLGMARFVDEIGSPYVKCYFDVGNVMRWGLPQQWIEVLGKRIGKVHIKEFSLKVAMKEGMLKAFDLPMGKGDIEWPVVCKQLEAVGYHSWITAEVRGGDPARIADVSAQMDHVLGL